MPQREFANQKALVAYAEQNDLAYEYEYTPAFAKRQRHRRSNTSLPRCAPLVA